MSRSIGVYPDSRTGQNECCAGTIKVKSLRFLYLHAVSPCLLSAIAVHPVAFPQL